jgi:hypothetical protein
MNREIYHNKHAKTNLVRLVSENNVKYRGQTAIIEQLIDILISRAVEEAATEYIGEAESAGIRVFARYEDEGGHNHFSIQYYYSTATGTNYDYTEYVAPHTDDADPLLVTGMIADEGF